MQETSLKLPLGCFELVILLALQKVYMQTILEILLVTLKTGVSKKTNAPFSISEAHCVLRNEDGTPGAVGVLVVPKGLEEVAKVGLFTASFGLIAAGYGEQQGRIVAQLAGLVPVTVAPKSRQA